MHSTEIGKDGNDSMFGYRVYRRRFAVLFTVAVLNISNAALWISYSPVATTVAEYYGVQIFAVNWFSLSFLLMAFPFSFISTFVVNKYGLKVGIHLGAGLNVVGSIIRAFGTSGVISDLGSQYAISLAGQTISAMAQSFLLFIPTKVSQLWFPENHRAVTTTLLAMSNPLGIVIAQGSTPFIVQDPQDVPTNNYVWCGVAILAEIMTVLSVTRNTPKTPPSRSAEKSSNSRPSYFRQLKETITCLPYFLLLLTLGCGIGLFSAIATLTQQLLCPLGYSDVVGGGANVALVLMGFVGAAIMGVLADKTKKFIEITKLGFAAAAFFGIFMMEFYLVPGQIAALVIFCGLFGFFGLGAYPIGLELSVEATYPVEETISTAFIFLSVPGQIAALVIFCGLFGFFGLGAYPIGLELSVEATYPVEETISTAFIFLSGQIHGILIIVLVPAFAREQPPERYYLDNCGSSDHQAMDYTVPVLVMMGYTVTVIAVMVLMMHTRYKRMETEENKRKSISFGSSNGAMFSTE